ncbi:MAG: alpha/beta fold hydrolase, partial [Verrucomicrobiota bacterium]
ASGHDFFPVAEQWVRLAKPKRWRFVLPHAPHQPVTVNQGFVMPAWYDILDLTESRAANWDTVAEGAKQIEAFLDAELAKTEKVVLAGFSQGAAMSLHVGLRHPSNVSGIVAMSGYLLQDEDHPCPEKGEEEFPIGIFHGDADPVVPVRAAHTAKKTLEEKGYEPTIQIYPGLEHSVATEEVLHVFRWLEAVAG